MKALAGMLLASGILLAAGTEPAGAIDASQICLLKKLDAAAKYGLCRMKAEAKAVKTGKATDYTKCDEQLSKQWGKIEVKAAGACPVTGDLSAIQAQVTGDADTLTDLLSAGSKTVFLSSVIYAGNLGGLAGADAKCQALADTAGLPGTYKAWLSDTVGGPSQRFVKSTGPYLLPSGAQIAANWTDLTDGMLDQQINEDETGNVQAGSPAVWTNTAIDGIPIRTDPGQACGNWTAATPTSASPVGSASQRNASWTDIGSLYYCGPISGENTFLFHLYCFEQ